MGEFKKLKVPQFPQIQEKETSEAKFWRNYSLTREDRHFSAPSSIHFDPSGSGNYLVTASTRVCLYDPMTDSIQRSFGRFQDDAYSAKFRKDGKLFVAGDKSGKVKVVDLQSKSIIREMKHAAAVHATCWSMDSLHMISASDDQSIKFWDLGTGDLIWQNNSYHTDYIRTLDNSPIDNHLFTTGSYDHSIALWDHRMKPNMPINTFQHDSPITQCMFAASGTMIISAYGNQIKLWDLFNTNKELHTFAYHQKNITNITMDGTNTRLLSSSLDGHIKIYNMTLLQYTYGIKCVSPVMSVATSYDNKKLIIGYMDGTLHIKNKKLNTSYAPIGIPKLTSIMKESKGNLEEMSTYLNPTDMIQEQAKLEYETNKNNRYYKGAGLSADIITDYNIETDRKIKLKSYEKYFKTFQYILALDSALLSKNPLIVVTVLEELCRSSGLLIALSSRDELTLEPLLSFLARYINHPRYAKLLIHITHTILDIYSNMIGYSETIDELFNKLKKQITQEVYFQKAVLQCMGMLDSIINNTTTTTTTTI